MEWHQPDDPFDQPIAHDFDRPTWEDFLGRLEYAPDVSGAYSYPSQDDGCVCRDGGMRIMAACARQPIGGAAEGG